MGPDQTGRQEGVYFHTAASPSFSPGNAVSQKEGLPSKGQEWEVQFDNHFLRVMRLCLKVQECGNLEPDRPVSK